MVHISLNKSILAGALLLLCSNTYPFHTSQEIRPKSRIDTQSNQSHPLTLEEKSNLNKRVLNFINDTFRIAKEEEPARLLEKKQARLRKIFTESFRLDGDLADHSNSISLDHQPKITDALSEITFEQVQLGYLSMLAAYCIIKGPKATLSPFRNRTKSLVDSCNLNLLEESKWIKDAWAKQVSKHKNKSDILQTTERPDWIHSTKAEIEKAKQQFIKSSINLKKYLQKQ